MQFGEDEINQNICFYIFIYILSKTFITCLSLSLHNLYEIMQIDRIDL